MNTETENKAQPAAENGQAIPEPVDGKYIFEAASNQRIRFNADGWVEEIGKGTADAPIGTLLQGKRGSKRDDIYVRRFYDLYSRVVLIDIMAKNPSDKTNTGGLIKFSDLETGSPMHERVNLIIKIANHHFGTSLKYLD